MSEAKCSVSSGEFIRWQAYFLRLYDRPSRTDWQIAKVAYEVAHLAHIVANIMSSNPPPFEPTVKSFLVEFEQTDGPVEPELPPDPPSSVEEEEDQRERIAMHKMLFEEIAKKTASVSRDGKKIV